MKRRTVIPRGLGAGLGDVVAAQRRHRDADDVVEPDLRCEGAVVGLDLVEDLLRVVDQVELVDGHDDVADAEQRHQVAVAPGLGEHALAGVDEDDGEVGGRGAGDHVAGVLLVARGVGDDELAPLGGEEAVGDVDGDALLALGGEAVDQEGEVELAALGADLLRVRLQRGQVVLEDQLRVVQQAADQRALAVVDAAAGDEAQHRLVLVALEIGVDVRGEQLVHGVGHQKYPSCFFFSMEPEESWSITRPCRSDEVVSSISWMISGSVAAVLSTAPVSG